MRPMAASPPPSPKTGSPGAKGEAMDLDHAVAYALAEIDDTLADPGFERP